MLALRLPPDVEKRLDDLARKTGRTKSFYAREAILEHIDDLEDLYLAKQRVEANGPRISLDEMIEKYNLDDADEV
jgi:RHH-type rel operon transcriptional repressor/antitoxin RelB